ncbi:MAG TPA: type II toxin-antitoxin system VapC family toxin [Porticoccaceae bacterium]|nr:type II toxin-antitoxin system VapC family toxin [Porticoccaceae bacterium]
MILLLDTHLLLWAAGHPERLSEEARSMITEPRNVLWFSAVSLWEITIKKGLGRQDFQIDPHLLRRGLLDNGYTELAITSQHAMATAHLPHLHKDPFDRMLVAQAESEGVLLLTADELVARYPGPVRRV